MSDLPLPEPTEDAAPFWEFCRNHELRLQRCTHCRQLRHPPQPMCPRCGAMEHDWAPVSGRGAVYSFVVSWQAVHPALHGRTPFATVLVRLEEGPLLVSNLVDCRPEEIALGMPVAVVFDDVTEAVSLPKFRLLDDAP